MKSILNNAGLGLNRDCSVNKSTKSQVLSKKRCSWQINKLEKAVRIFNISYNQELELGATECLSQPIM